MCLLWFNWKECNSRMFDEMESSLLQLKFLHLRYLFDWLWAIVGVDCYLSKKKECGFFFFFFGGWGWRLLLFVYFPVLGFTLSFNY